MAEHGFDLKDLSNTNDWKGLLFLTDIEN